MVHQCLLLYHIIQDQELIKLLVVDQVVLKFQFFLKINENLNITLIKVDVDLYNQPLDHNVQDQDFLLPLSLDTFLQ